MLDFIHLLITDSTVNRVNRWPTNSQAGAKREYRRGDGGVDRDRGGERVTPNPNLNCCQLTAHCRV